MIDYTLHIEHDAVHAIGPFLVLEMSKTSTAQTLNTGLCLVQVLDVSGSMEPYMDHVVSTAFATVDAVASTKDSTIETVAFDSKVYRILDKTYIPSRSFVDTLYLLLRTRLKNEGGTTNIEAVLHSVLKDRKESHTHIMFITDGLANTGNVVSSDGLLQFARSLPGYSNISIHTLGLALNGNTSLNSALLRELALDTNGVFRVVKTIDDLPTFLGDIRADHECTVLRNLQISAFQIEGHRIGPINRLLTRVPLSGPSLRHDRPLRLVWALESASATVNAKVALQVFGQHTHDGSAYKSSIDLVANTQDINPETISIAASANHDVTYLNRLVTYCDTKVSNDTSLQSSEWMRVKALIESRIKEIQNLAKADALDTSQMAYELSTPMALRLTPNVNTLRQESQAKAQAHFRGIARAKVDLAARDGPVGGPSEDSIDFS
jgi:hypothetical protein